ncbi:hypothetical protein ACWFR4_47695, partial [Streptomyces sp. NPDC055140]
MASRTAPGPDGHLADLLDHLPEQIAQHPGTVQSITDWLASALKGYVLVSGGTQMLAASPESAPTVLAPLLMRSGQSQGAALGTGGLQHRVIPLDLPGSEAAAVAVASDGPWGSDEHALIRQAVKVLSMAVGMSQVRLVEDAWRNLGHATFQLLMLGLFVEAQRVMAPLAPGLLDTRQVRVYVIDCGTANRENSAAECDRAIAGRGLLVRCPGIGSHLIVVDPLHGDESDPDSLAATLRRTVASMSGHRMGLSLTHPLGDVSAAHSEAESALVAARDEADRAAVYTARPRILD